MQIRAGSLLIAHPAFAHREQRNHVVYVTESTEVSTMGLTLNNVSKYDLKEVFENKGIEWYGPREVYHGGEYNNSALVMLHSDEWYSQNTMQVNNQLAMSSDSLMIEKMEMADTPDWYRLFVGCKGWEHDDLGYELKSKKPKWILLTHPSIDLLDTAPAKLWNAAINECSQDLFNEYF
jgi:putative AlgH/UPF0301 family transcriptional regulator|tara:strand:- start:223 stop:756 length:534 start_codon:yes stop_codon:yes gene_type:complete